MFGSLLLASLASTTTLASYIPLRLPEPSPQSTSELSLNSVISPRSIPSIRDAANWFASGAIPSKSKLERRAAALPPKVKSVSVLGNVTDPGLDRDSCGSARVGGRVLWVCRDTLVWNTATQQDNFPLIVNTAGWTNWSSTSGPTGIQSGSTAPKGCASAGNPIYQMYGQNTTNPSVYYPLASDMCPDYGLCSDNSRWVYWPNSPPMITTNQTASSTAATGYTWIDKKHISGLTQLNPNPPYTLFKTSWSGSSSLPTTTVVNDTFWKAGEIGFGNYGNVIRNGYAYLYGQNNASQTLLARVPTGSIENRAAYQYWYQNAWSTTVPNINNTNSTISNAGGGGQGTFYFSTYFNSYLWLGQGLYDNNANFYMSYASQPQGPWSSLTRVYQGQNANGSFVGAYSLQAHPGLLPSNTATENGIYISWTIPQNSSNSYNGSYLTPLAYLTWQ